MPDQRNTALIARAQAGDESALGAIYDQYHNDVFRYLYYRIGDRDTAEDLSADVFLRVIKALPGYRQQGAPFKAWLLRIAHNMTVDHMRKMNIRNHLPLNEEILSNDEHLDALAENQMMSEQLVLALETLTQEQRDVIILRFVMEMPINQVANVMDKSVSAIKALQRRGLRSLRKTLITWKVPYV